MLLDMCMYRDCLLSPTASEPLVRVNNPKALLATSFLVTDDLDHWRGVYETKTHGKRTSSRETQRGRYVGLFFSDSEQNIDELNTVLPITVTASDYAKLVICQGPGTVVGIATGYGLDGPGIESRRGEFFRTCPDRPWGPPSLLYNGYRVFPRGRAGLGRSAIPHTM